MVAEESVVDIHNNGPLRIESKLPSLSVNLDSDAVLRVVKLIWGSPQLSCLGKGWAMRAVAGPSSDEVGAAGNGGRTKVDRGERRRRAVWVS
ncbi:hypothetical protein Droror1_Dr00023332 [Drosera rotundifolia]